MVDYRENIYSKYRSKYKKGDSKPDLKLMDRWGRVFYRHIKNYLPERKDAKILEIACGDGIFLRLLQKQGYNNFYGIDISREQINAAKHITDSVEVKDAFDFLKGIDKTYDLIVALDLVEHLRKEEILEFCELCHKKLNFGGKIILHTPNAASPFSNSMMYGDLTHENIFTPKGLANLMNLFGFDKCVSIESGPVIHGFLSFCRLLMWKLISSLLYIWQIAETGDIHNKIFTRVFIFIATKREKNGSK